VSDILCIFYSRTGNTQQAVEEIGQALDAEIVRIADGVERGGWRGYVRCGMDAMRKSSDSLLHFETDRPLEDYRLVILGTPVWAGRCSAPIRSFLKAYGGRLQNVAYVLTRGGDNKYEDIYDQMDHYLFRPHQLAVSLRSDSVGYHFWQEEFLRQVRDFLTQEQ